MPFDLAPYLRQSFASIHGVFSIVVKSCHPLFEDAPDFIIEFRSFVLVHTFTKFTVYSRKSSLTKKMVVSENCHELVIHGRNL